MINIRTINNALTTLDTIRSASGRVLRHNAKQAKYSAIVEIKYHQLRERSSEANALVAKSNSLSVRTETLAASQDTIEESLRNPTVEVSEDWKLEN